MLEISGAEARDAVLGFSPVARFTGLSRWPAMKGPAGLDLLAERRGPDGTLA